MAKHERDDAASGVAKAARPSPPATLGPHFDVVALIGVWSPPFSPQPPQRSCILLLDYLL